MTVEEIMLILEKYPKDTKLIIQGTDPMGQGDPLKTVKRIIEYNGNFVERVYNIGLGDTYTSIEFKSRRKSDDSELVLRVY